MEKIQRQKIASLIGHVFQLTYAAMFGTLIQEEKLNRCNGCAIHNPSLCLMMDNEEAWMYYRDNMIEKIDLNAILKTTESVCSSQSPKLAKSWEVYVTDLPKMSWTSIYLTSLELDGVADDLQSRILYAIYYGPCGLKCNDPRLRKLTAKMNYNAPKEWLEKRRN